MTHTLTRGARVKSEGPLSSVYGVVLDGPHSGKYWSVTWDNGFTTCVHEDTLVVLPPRFQPKDRVMGRFSKLPGTVISSSDGTVRVLWDNTREVKSIEEWCIEHLPKATVEEKQPPQFKEGDVVSHLRTGKVVATYYNSTTAAPYLVVAWDDGRTRSEVPASELEPVVPAQVPPPPTPQPEQAAKAPEASVQVSVRQEVSRELERLCGESRDKPTPLSELIHHRISKFLPSDAGKKALASAAPEARPAETRENARLIVRALLKEIAQGADQELLRELAVGLLGTPDAEATIRDILLGIFCR